MTCCVCTTTSINTPNAIFTRVPVKSKKNIIGKNDDDKIRRAKYKRKYEYKAVRERLKIKRNDHRKNIRFCDQHPREIIQQKFTWVNVRNETIEEEEDFILPVLEQEPTD
jgi:hypothetical protein